MPEANNETSLARIKKATGKTIRFIDEKTEVELTILGVVPKDERDTAVRWTSAAATRRAATSRSANLWSTSPSLSTSP